jgi:RimJ/RimL family protein N-acetyltransferase
MDYSTQTLSTSSVHVEFFLVPWDTEILAFPVGQISAITCFDQERAQADFSGFERWRDEQEIRLISCRLPHDRLIESMFLEQRGFRFVEMIYKPRLDTVQEAAFQANGLEIAVAGDSDVPILEQIAGGAFRTDRFHVDPRLEGSLGDRRYRTWVRNSFEHPTQRPLKIVQADAIVGFFVVEYLPGNHCYWHLTALTPEVQGKGLGKRAWRAMISHHKEIGVASIETTISARNAPAVNLYASLGFRFQSPAMTLHWYRT